MPVKDRYSCIQKCLRKSGASGASLGVVPNEELDSRFFEGWLKAHGFQLTHKILGAPVWFRDWGEEPLVSSTLEVELYGGSPNSRAQRGGTFPLVAMCLVTNWMKPLDPAGFALPERGAEALDYLQRLMIQGDKLEEEAQLRRASPLHGMGLPYHRDDVGRPDAAELRQMPTLAVSQADDLKIDTGETRVWLARTGVEDGEPFDNKVTIERLVKGRWEVEATYPGGLGGLPGGDPFYVSAPQHGFFVTSQSPDVAWFSWFKTQAEAESAAQKMNAKGDARYVVMPAPPIGTSGLAGRSSGPRMQPGDWESPIDTEPEREGPGANRTPRKPRAPRRPYTTTAVLPAFLASALINGDTSSLDDGDMQWYEEALKYAGDGQYVDVGEPYFAWRNELPGFNLGADVAEYTILYAK